MIFSQSFWRVLLLPQSYTKSQNRARLTTTSLGLYTTNMLNNEQMIHKLRSWTYRQLRLGQATAEPAEVLHNVIAVYSSHPSAPLSLLNRSRAFTAIEFSEMEQRRQVVRIPAMRNSIFLVPTA